MKYLQIARQMKPQPITIDSHFQALSVEWEKSVQLLEFRKINLLSSQFLQQQNEIFPIECGVSIASRWVLPINIDSIKIVNFTEFGDILSEFKAFRVTRCDLQIRRKLYHSSQLLQFNGHYRRKCARSLIPTANRCHCFQLGILFFQRIELLNVPATVVVRQIQIRVENTHSSILGNAKKRVNQVRTQIRIDVVDIELAVPVAIGCPCAIVANDLS